MVVTTLYGYVWVYWVCMGIYISILGFFLGIFDSVWVYMDINGYVRLCMGINGYVWIFKNFLKCVKTIVDLIYYILDFAALEASSNVCTKNLNFRRHCYNVFNSLEGSISNLVAKFGLKITRSIILSALIIHL